MSLGFPEVLAIYKSYLKINLVSVFYVNSPHEKALICSRHFSFRGKKDGSNVSQNILKTCHETVKSDEALSYAEIPRKVCSGVRIDDGNKKLVEEVNGWMIKKLSYKIKDSGLV